MNVQSYVGLLKREGTQHTSAVGFVKGETFRAGIFIFICKHASSLQCSIFFNVAQFLVYDFSISYRVRGGWQ